MRYVKSGGGLTIITQKHGTQSCGSCTWHAFKTSCTIQSSIINISERVLELSRSQSFYYQILSGEITEKPEFVWFLHATHLLNLL